MRGLRIDWGSTRKRRRTSSLKYYFYRKLAPDPSATPEEVLVPPYASDFSRMFGPVFPEVLQRKWLICDFLWTLEEPDFFETEETSQAVSDLKAQILEEFDQEVGIGDFWILTTGEHLVRVSNHLYDSEATLIGIPAATFDDFEKARKEVIETEKLKSIALSFSDIAFDIYEGFWGAFFAEPRLLARTFYHCSEIADVYEVEDGVGIYGDWLTRIQKSCPNLPQRLAAEPSQV